MLVGHIYSVIHDGFKLYKLLADPEGRRPFFTRGNAFTNTLPARGPKRVMWEAPGIPTKIPGSFNHKCYDGKLNFDSYSFNVEIIGIFDENYSKLIPISRSSD